MFIVKCGRCDNRCLTNIICLEKIMCLLLKEISVEDMLKLKGLKDAWSYVMDSLDEELNIYYIKKSILKFIKVKIFYHWAIFVVDE